MASALPSPAECCPSPPCPSSACGTRIDMTALVNQIMTGLMPFANVKSAPFYAAGDGVTDDTAAIQSALDQAESIMFPAGTYNITAPLTIVGHHKVIWGTGDAVIRYVGAGAVLDLISVGDPGGLMIFNNTIHDLDFCGNAHVQNILHLKKVNHCSIRNVRLYNCTGAGAVFETCVLGLVDNLSVSKNEINGFAVTPLNGLYLNGCNSIQFNDVIVEGVSGDGIVGVNNTAGCSFIGGTSEGNGSWGAFSASCNANVILNSYAEQSTGAYDLFFSGASNANVVIGGEYTKGISINGCSGIKLIGIFCGPIAADVTSVNCSAIACNVGILAAGSIALLGTNSEQFANVDFFHGTIFRPHLLSPVIEQRVSYVGGVPVTIPPTVESDTSLTLKSGAASDVLLTPGNGGVVAVLLPQFQEFTIRSVAPSTATWLRFENAGITVANNRDWALVCNVAVYGDFAIMTSNAEHQNPRTAGTARFYIDPTGKMGNVVTPTSALQISGLPVHANNGDAITAGLTVGAFYRNGADPDVVCVVH